MTITRTSMRNLDLADSFDIWPVDDHRGDGGGWMVVVFRNGFSSVTRKVLSCGLLKAQPWATSKRSLPNSSGIHAILGRVSLFNIEQTKPMSL